MPQGKVIAVDDNLTLVYEDHVSYDKDLPEFGTSGGFRIHEDSSITAPSAMFIEALDMILDRMKTAGFPFGKIVAVAGDTQQSGSVYWKYGAKEKLNNLDVNKSLYEQLKDVFSIPDPPIWLDDTSSKQCQQLEQAIGGPMKLAILTGARALNYDTAPEIMKIFQTQREAYDNTERISLISSLMASLFLGDYAPIDFGDGSITNLLNINTKHWASGCLDACGGGLARKLGEPVHSQTILGNVSSYLQQKYNFSKDCKLLAWTGDNPQSVVGLALRNDELTLTLGTSDVFYLCSSTPIPNLFGHVLIGALDPNSYITMIGWKNGSRIRQHVMEKCAGSWEKFTEIFNSTPPGNNGNIGIYFETTEVMPRVLGTFRFNGNNDKVESFPPEVEVRAVLEGQFLARRLYAERCGLKLGPDRRIVATGGASANETILQVIADIFNTPVYTIDVPNSASLGGCYRAKLAVDGVANLSDLKGIADPVCVAKPNQGFNKVYDEMLVRYQKLEELITSESEARE